MDEAVQQITPGVILGILLLLAVLIMLGVWIIPKILALLD